ncbi:acyl-CoA thioesterase [Oceanospirillum sediminis]|uniref:Acyl-CoA thioesterase n=1 Tax=Oceanospirillum sediminis TaxID=2760088 RepID=A0A839INW2_9GAMM|nr:thioesterase family protein [Oceanospirillum sediminis]MBB1486189.1 acyl-CoA thioesterase [Oceanospirillum sediminis]
MTLRADLKLEDFPFQTFDKIRYADTDRQGHVNNAVFSTFLETGRVEFLYNPDTPLTAENGAFVIANLNLNLMGEIRWPGQVDIGTGLIRLGNSSIGLYQSVFQNGRCVANAETVIVQMDEVTRRSSPLTEQARAFLAEHLLHTES